MGVPRHLEVVVKISKHCNLRCTYCYELKELSNTKRMSLSEIRRMFSSFNDYLKRQHSSVDFIWHGGEPLLIKPSYYRDISAVQQELLGDHGVYRNLVQTNLTILNDDILDFLQSKTFFDGFGVSVDPFGTERIDIRGRGRNEQLFDNMQRLIDNDVAFGGLTVLTQESLSHIDQTFLFFDSLNVRFRVLPFYKSVSSEQYAGHYLSNQEIVGAFKGLFDLWLASENAVQIQPIHEYMDYAIRYIKGTTKRHLNMVEDESWFIVGLDGTVWGQSDTYTPSAQYGNIFEQDFESILGSKTRQRLCQEAADRCGTHCGSCSYYGYCPGSFVMFATAEERLQLAESGCPVRPVVDHIIRRFEELGLADQLPEIIPDGHSAAIGRA